MVARLLYRDGLMLVIDKPAGIAVHKGPKGGESLEDHFGALRFGLPRAPALAHRLDRDTSGCLVLGRHRKALAELGRLFKQGRVGKTYWAVVEGGPAEDEGRIDLPLGRLDESRGWWMKPDPQGQPAVTTWKVMGRARLATFTSPGRRRASPPACGGGREGVTRECELLHPTPASPGGDRPSALQGRVKDSSPGWRWSRSPAARISCACIAPPWAGRSSATRSTETRPRAGGPGLHLHSREVVVPLYKNRAPITVSAPVPLHMHATLQACGWQGEVFRLMD